VAVAGTIGFKRKKNFAEGSSQRAGWCCRLAGGCEAALALVLSLRPPKEDAGRRATGQRLVPGPIDRAPNLRPVAARDVGHAAVALEKLVRQLEDGEDEPALRTPG
jgi:hypothetical protein